MKNILFILTCLFIFSCKKSELPTDLRIKTIKYYRSDTVIGQINYEYSSFTNLLEREYVYYANYFLRHVYLYQNDSITVQEAEFTGTDTAYNTLVVHLTGEKHIVTKITADSKTYTYSYDANSRLTSFAWEAILNTKDLVFNGGDVISYNVLTANIYSPSGFDTLTNSLSYTSRSNQPGVNFIPYIESPVVSIFFLPFENTMNLELAGCTFNLHDHLVETDFIHSSSDNTELHFSYTFDNNGRIKTKSYSTPFFLSGPFNVRAEYQYMN